MSISITISTKAQEKLQDIYDRFPEISERERQLVEDLLYHLSVATTLRIDVVENSLLVTHRGKF